MRYRRVGRLSCCCVCQAVVVVINASRRAMTAYGFPRRRDAIGVAIAVRLLGCCVALLPHSSNVSTHAQSTEAIRQFRCLRAVRQHECWLRRDYGRRIQHAASSRSNLQHGDFYPSSSRNTRTNTTVTKKRLETQLVMGSSASRTLVFTPREKTRQHRAHLHARKASTAAKASQPQRDQQFGKKAAQKQRSPQRPKAA